MDWITGQGPRPRPGNTIEFLIDNAAAWGRLADAVGNAHRSVRCLIFMWDLPHVRMGFPQSWLGRPGAPGAVRLEDRLLAAASNGAEVSLLLNDVRPGISPANTVRPVERFFARTGRVRLRRLRTPQAVPIHAKLFLIDDELAFSIGSVFAQEYFDDAGHLIDDPRRGHVRWRSSVRAPIHDVSAVVTGPAVADLDGTFRLHWNDAGPDDLPPFAGDPTARPGGVPLQVTRTLTGGRYSGLPDGETGILDSYRRAIRSARRSIYLENQYLTLPAIVDELVAALHRQRDLEVIALINNRPDVPYYAGWQREALQRLYAGMDAGTRERLGVFTLWSRDGARLSRIHVHSKVAVIDDEWLTVGSANLDGISLLASEHLTRATPLLRRLGRLIGAFGPGDPEQARSTEVNLTCGALSDDEPAAAQIAGLRTALWSEHLSLDPGDLEKPPAGGWLPLWRDRASELLADLRAGRRSAAGSRARVLPFPHTGADVPAGTSNARVYLRRLGVDTRRLEVRSTLQSYDFRRGRWR